MGPNRRAAREMVLFLVILGFAGGCDVVSMGMATDPAAEGDVVTGQDAEAQDDVAEEEDSTEPEAEDFGVNPFVDTLLEDTSTFAVDVDTASYTLSRKHLLMGILPEPWQVRIEEFINFFDYDYPQPQDEHPFSINLDAAPSRFGEGYKLLRIGLQGYEVPEDQRQPANLVFLVDVSGSMAWDNKLPLVQYTLKRLVQALRSDDTLGIVVYAGTDAVLLEPTPVLNKAEIQEAIAALTAGGSTAGAAGILTAYELAEGAYIQGGINRVILCTDGDFNVGLTGDALLAKIVEYREKGVTLTIFGYGTGNYNDADMEALSNAGNGNYAYIDGPAEVIRIIGEKLVATLQVIAKDVKIQVQFNVETVERWRLIGYDNRIMENIDFIDDTKDAGEIGAGHNVTAIYELELVPDVTFGQLAEVRFRYKEPEGSVSTEITRTFDVESIHESFADAHRDFRFASAVVEFGEILRWSQYVEEVDFDAIVLVAENALSEEPPPARLEFMDLVEIAEQLW